MGNCQSQGVEAGDQKSDNVTTDLSAEPLKHRTCSVWLSALSSSITSSLEADRRRKCQERLRPSCPRSNVPPAQPRLPSTKCALVHKHRCCHCPALVAEVCWTPNAWCHLQAAPASLPALITVVLAADAAAVRRKQRKEPPHGVWSKRGGGNKKNSC